MTLEIQNPNKVDLSEFCVDLIEALRNYAIDPQNMDKGLADMWNQYFEATDLGWPVDGTGQPAAPTFQYIVNQWFSHLDWFCSNSNYYIIPDDKLRLNSSEITIDSLARMINYGVLGVSAYRYFDEVFDLAASQLTELYNRWAGIEEEQS